jgi:hypothetical protein
MIDVIPLTKTVLFVGDYFSMMTTVVLTEELRNEEEDDSDFAIRLAGVLLEEFYGWNVAEVSKEIGVIDEDEEE